MRLVDGREIDDEVAERVINAFNKAMSDLRSYAENAAKILFRAVPKVIIHDDFIDKSNVDFNRQPAWLRGGGDGFRFHPRRQRRPPDVVRFERERRARMAAAKRVKRTNRRRNRVRREW